MKAAFVLALLMLAPPALAQEVPDLADWNHDCMDDDGVDRCRETHQADRRKAYDVPEIATYEASGAQVMRSFFVDGYGQDMPLVSFERLPGQEPRVVVRTAGPGERRGMSIAVPVAAWDRLVERSRFFDRDLAGDKREAGMCLHSWQVTVETVGIRPDGGPARPRRKTQGACGGGLAIELGFELAREAVAQLPACSTLDPKEFRNDVTILAACTLLEGDRAAAALAMNQYQTNGFANPYGSGAADRIWFLFFDQATFDWPGEPRVEGSREAAERWVERMQKRHFYPRRFVGETPDRVRVEGLIADYGESGEPGREARAEQIWTRENGFDFRVRSVKVEAFVPSKPPTP